LLAVAAISDKGFFKGGDLLIEEVIGLVDEAKNGVGADCGVSVVESVGVEGVTLLISQIG
jgi:hypothetical protein